MVEDILDEGDVKRKSKHFDGEEERVTKKMRVVEDEDEDEDEIERKEKQEQEEEEEEEEKREAKVMKVEEEEEDKEEKVRALLSSPSLSPPVEVEAEVDCASSPPRMSLNIMDNNNNSGASTSSNMRQVPSRIETGILSKVPPELLCHILKFLSPEVIFAVNFFSLCPNCLSKYIHLKAREQIGCRGLEPFMVSMCISVLIFCCLKHYLFYVKSSRILWHVHWSASS